MSNIWNNSKDEKIKWVENFKNVFINQKKEMINKIFNEEKFGRHNSYSMVEYCEKEFDEFRLKCSSFGLGMDAQVFCYDISEDLFYFSIGKKEDNALFEAIFGWDDTLKLAIGNQYNFIIEPKIQFIKNNVGDINKVRRVNIKSSNKNTVFKKVILLKEMPHEEQLNFFKMEDIFGGSFVSYSFEFINDDCLTKWEDIRIYSNAGNFSEKILLRGIDHPLFIDDIFPIINKDNKGFILKDHFKPVVINVKTKNGNDFLYKYPTEKSFIFKEEIEYVCITDTLSFDWIINL